METNKINRYIKLLMLFTGGGLIYGGIEIIARDFTHVSMFIAGGLSFLFIGSLKRIRCKTNGRKTIPVMTQMLISAAAITVIELLFGIVVNIWWGMEVWDYSDEPLNLLGQICAHTSGIWVFLSFIGIYLDSYARRKMFGEKFAPMRILP